ncbi:MAG TPA: serine/threonine-protein kinase [Acidobacteriota bacterium]|nr:serine/threonine-protein kinase [Acidobacteriota bacterium]
MAQVLFKGQQLGKYEVLDSLGTGGFAAVYLARDSWINKMVALKIPHYQNYDLDHLLKEPRLVAKLNHPNIINVHSAEKSGDLFFIVMEYVDGESLEETLDREKILPHKLASQYIMQICDALEYAHSQQVLHRDLRPANIMISKTGILKVGDFGVAALLEKMPYAKTIIGTPPYMAPEHLAGKAVYASDVYSVGIIFYEMLTATLPYYDVNPAKIEQLINEGRCTPPKVLNKDIPRDLNDIVLRAMARNIEDRFGSCYEFGQTVRQFLGNTPERKEMSEIKTRISARQTTPSPNCWNCGRPLPRYTKVCPKCNQTQ